MAKCKALTGLAVKGLIRFEKFIKSRVYVSGRLSSTKVKARSHTARQRASMCGDVRHNASRCGMWRRKLRRNETSFDFCVMWRTSTRVDMRHITQKWDQYWFLRYVTHVNARWRAACEWAYSRLESMPLGDLFPRTVDHLVPVTLGRRVGFMNPISHLQPTDHFVAGDAVPVVDDEVQSNALQVCAAAGTWHWGRAGVRQVELERLVECRVESFLLHLRLLLADALPVVQQPYLDVRVCTAVTRNVTGRHRGPKRKLRDGYRAPSRHRRAMCRHSYFCLLDILHCNARHIFHRRVWCCALSLRCARAMLVFDVRHHPHPLGYPCAKFHFCCWLRCWASPWRKSRTQSLTRPAYLVRREPKLSLRNIFVRENSFCLRYCLLFYYSFSLYFCCRYLTRFGYFHFRYGTLLQH